MKEKIILFIIACIIIIPMFIIRYFEVKRDNKVEVCDTIYNKVTLDSIEYNIIKRDSIIYNIKYKMKNEIEESKLVDDSGAVAMFNKLVAE